MTNGEKLQETFPNMRITVCKSYVQVMGEKYEFNNTYPLDWWYAEYKEPNCSEIATGSTTKDCLAVEQIVDEVIKKVMPIKPKGHWIETAEEYYKAINEKGGGVNKDTDFFTDDIACSECLAKFSVIDNEAERFDFCPCCGSDNR